jgi:hypothetical protein
MRSITQKTCSIVLGALLAAGLLSPADTQAEDPQEKTREVVPDASLAAGKTHRWLFGAGYRDLWTTAIEVDVLDLRNYAGGLTITGTGKGKQSLGLRFVGADGRPYTFRPLQKSLLDLLPEFLYDTFVVEIVEDQVKSALPTAPPVVPVILDSVSVLHATPQLVVIPDDPYLGEYRDHFAGMAGTIEEWPNEGKDNTPGFAGATEIHSTEELFEFLRGDPAERIDARNFLTARLVDILIGDWDRHDGQWRWANVGEGTPPAWLPIPEDRDQAFAKYDGVLFGIARWVSPQLTNFGSKYNRVHGMIWAGREIDRWFLTGLSRADWREVAADVQSRIDDEVIEDALKQLPPAHYEIAAEDTAASLKARRAELPEKAEKFYSILAGEVDVHATHAAEVVEAVRLKNGDLALSVFTTEDGEKSSTPYYYRMFLHEETDDVRVYLYGGDDRVLVQGEGRPVIPLRIISDAGRDEVVDASEHGGTKVYDSRKEGGVSVSGDVYLNRKVYTPPARSMFQPPTRDWGNMYQASGAVNMNSDLGLLLGAGLSVKRFGFRRYPFATRVNGSLAYATKLQNFRLNAGFDYTWENSKQMVQVDLLASGIETIFFYGLGNETEQPEDPKDARAIRRVVQLAPAFTFVLTPYWRFQAGMAFEYSSTEDKPGSVIGQLEPRGSGEFWHGGFTAHFELDALDSHAWPSRGIYFKLAGEYFPASSHEDFGRFGAVEGRLTGVIPIYKKLALATQVGGRQVWGDYPYYKAAYIGGGRTLRGYDRERFGGDGAVYANLDLRFPVSKFFFFLPGEAGLFGFVDTGRVFYAGESSDKWHTGYGGGIWVAPLLRQLTLSLAVAGSDEGTRIYFSFGMGY